jgi:hypothetical protein
MSRQDLVVVQRSWGAFSVHSKGCPTAERDFNLDGILEIEVDAVSRYDLSRQLQELLGNTQDNLLFQKRLIYHSLRLHGKDVCTAKEMK